MESDFYVLEFHTDSMTLLRLKSSGISIACSVFRASDYVTIARCLLPRRANNVRNKHCFYLTCRRSVPGRVEPWRHERSQQKKRA